MKEEKHLYYKNRLFGALGIEGMEQCGYLQKPFDYATTTP